MRPATIGLREAYEHYYVKFKDVVWIDVRHPSDYAVGRVRGAINIPVTKIADNLSRIPRDKELVLYCEGTWRGGLCGASYSAARIVIKHGYKPGRIKVFEDGHGWRVHKRYPSESTPILEILFGKKKT